jgi:DnaK suppressor protein
MHYTGCLDAGRGGRIGGIQLGLQPLVRDTMRGLVRDFGGEGGNVATKSVAKKVRVLTEPDLLKASDKEYMSEEQLAFFRQRLLELRAQLLNNADDTGENEVTTDPSDRATLEEEYTLELRTRDRERKLLKKIEKSLKMIDDGTYGYCEETGEPIGIPRLLARPTATLSLEAQERRERVQKLYGD